MIGDSVFGTVAQSRHNGVFKRRVAEHRQNLLEALAPYGIEESRLPDPINVFMRTPPRPDGEFNFQPAPSKAGDRIVLRAFTDVVAAVSSCPMDLSPINGGRITPLKLVVAVSPDPG